MSSTTSNPPPARHGLPRIATATSVGTAIEYYDFIAYAIAAGMVFNRVFFPELDSLTGTLLSFVVFFTGFLARPLGAILTGHFGDRVGRKRMFMVTVLTMGIATVLIGTLPTYQQVGVLAPVVLLLLRVLQGLAAGGEWGGAALVAVEHAPPGKLGLYGSFSMVGISAGGLLATVAFALLSFLDEETFLQWGWRLPFLASAVLIAVGFWVRRSLAEPEKFRAARADASVARLPIVELMRTAWRSVLLATGVSIGYNAFIYLVFTFGLAYATGQLGLPRQLVLTATVVGLAVQIPSIVAAAMLSDRYPRGRIMIASGVFMAVDAFVFLALLGTGNTAAVYVTVVLAYAGAALMYGPLAAYFAESFDLRVRYSGISLSYQLGASLGGGLTPTALTLLVMMTGGAMAASAYVSALAVVAVACVVGMDRLARTRAADIPEDAVGSREG